MSSLLCQPLFIAWVGVQLSLYNSSCGEKMTSPQQPGNLQLVRVWHQVMWHLVTSPQGATIAQEKTFAGYMDNVAERGSFPVFSLVGKHKMGR